MTIPAAELRSYESNSDDDGSSYYSGSSDYGSSVGDHTKDEGEETILDEDDMKIVARYVQHGEPEPGLTHYSAELILKENNTEVVAATLVAKCVNTFSKYSIYEICDGVSGEMLDTGVKLFTEDARVRREIVSLLNVDEDDLHFNQDFFYIHTVKVEKRYRGNALGLKLIAAVLNEVRGMIKLVGICADYDFPLDDCLKDSSEKEAMDQQQIKQDRLYQYYLRLEGFKQVSKKEPQFFVRGYYKALDEQKILSREEVERTMSFFPWIRPQSKIQ